MADAAFPLKRSGESGTGITWVSNLSVGLGPNYVIDIQRILSKK